MRRPRFGALAGNAAQSLRTFSGGQAMADITSQDMATKLLAAGFERNSSSAPALTDPIADPPMIVTVDQLRPYDSDPRLQRNSADRKSTRLNSSPHSASRLASVDQTKKTQ